MARRNKADRLTRTDLKQYLSVWPTVMREATDDWAKEFALSIWRQSGEPQWMPTLKQSRVMRRMVRETKPFSAVRRSET